VRFEKNVVRPYVEDTEGSGSWRGLKLKKLAKVIQTANIMASIDWVARVEAIERRLAMLKEEVFQSNRQLEIIDRKRSIEWALDQLFSRYENRLSSLSDSDVLNRVNHTRITWNQGYDERFRGSNVRYGGGRAVVLECLLSLRADSKFVLESDHYILPESAIRGASKEEIREAHLRFQRALQQVVQRITGIETCVTEETSGYFQLIFRDR
jgi:hypothetical protein